MIKQEFVKNTLKELDKHGLYYKAVCKKSEIIINLGYTNAPENYKQYKDTEEDQLIYLFRELSPEQITKTEYGYTKKELRIKI